MRAGGSAVRSAREQRGWTQQELADAAGVSRQLLGALEAGRHAPGVDAALAIAAALDVTVEEPFGARPHRTAPVFEEANAARSPRGVLAARMGDHTVYAPLRHATEGWPVADATVAGDDELHLLPYGRPADLAAAGCDPALGLLSAVVATASPHRVLALHASTGAALEALGRGRLHAVVVHGRAGRLPAPPVPVARWHMARWQVGLAGARRRAGPDLEELCTRGRPVAQRGPDAASQQALVRAARAIGAAGPPRGPVASSHLDAARRVVHGAAAGLTMEAAALSLDLVFTPLEVHVAELWVAEEWLGLRATDTLLEILAGRGFTDRLAAVGGYDVGGCGTSAGDR